MQKQSLKEYLCLHQLVICAKGKAQQAKRSVTLTAGGQQKCQIYLKPGTISYPQLYADDFGDVWVQPKLEGFTRQFLRQHLLRSALYTSLAKWCLLAAPSYCASWMSARLIMLLGEGSLAVWRFLHFLLSKQTLWNVKLTPSCQGPDSAESWMHLCLLEELLWRAGIGGMCWALGYKTSSHKGIFLQSCWSHQDALLGSGSWAGLLSMAMGRKDAPHPLEAV